jgi:sugar/nucleoside kinase (ribokinase family)
MIDFLVSISNIFIDDILTWDDRINLGTLGGAGLHALSGCGIWNSNLGIIASVGKDFDPFRHALKRCNIDDEGLQLIQEKTTRAWQLFQPGDERVEILRRPRAGLTQALLDFNKLSRKYAEATGYHILWGGTEDALFTQLASIRAINPATVIAYEPSPEDCGRGEDFYTRLFGLIDAFSPSLSESFSISHQSNAEDAIDALMIGMGCPRVVIRDGEHGSIGCECPREYFRVPAVDVDIVDVTGAGNAFVGGLLAGLSSARPFVASLAMAAVSAAFEIEQYGLCVFRKSMEEERDRRFRTLLKQIKKT